MKHITYPLPLLPLDPRPLIEPVLKPSLIPIPGLYHFALDRNGQVQRWHLRNKRWDELPLFRQPYVGSAVLRLNIGKFQHMVPLWLIWAHTYLPCPLHKHQVFWAPDPYYLADPLALAWVEPDEVSPLKYRPRTNATVEVPEILGLIPAPDITLRSSTRLPPLPTARKIRVPLPSGISRPLYNECLILNSHLANPHHPDYHILEAYRTLYLEKVNV